MSICVKFASAGYYNASEWELTEPAGRLIAATKTKGYGCGKAIMKKATLILCLCLSLGACALFPGAHANSSPAAPLSEPATPTPVMPPELKGDLAIQELMLASHTRWRSLHAIYTTIQYPSTGLTAEPDQQNVQVWVQLPAQFKVLVSRPKGGPQTVAICDGQNILDSSGFQQSLPPAVLEQFNPPNTPSDTVYPYPLSGFLGTSVSDLIFPAALAQRGGEYRQTGQESVAGRQAYVVEWSREPGKIIDRFWVDQQTGVILRQQNYGKQNSLSPVNDFQATYIEIDSDLPADIFSLAAVPATATVAQPLASGVAWVTVKTEVAALNVRSQPDIASKVLTTMSAGQRADVLGKNLAGDWWQVTVNGISGWVFAEYVDFTGDSAAPPVVQP